MNDKQIEKQRKRELKQQWQEEQQRLFEESLPMERAFFTQLFDALDEQLEICGCDHTSSKTVEILNRIDIKNIEGVVVWLREHGGYCDCEVLWNVEEYFE
ncbi:DUF2695 domain-containing protein [Myroides sp. BIT-d1]|uniref:DUF2695 domain-containing protein n=2 Tax=Flavobacteriaceae TaxID=49546 RepID=A0A6I3LGY9_9FLAO|nr:DUF2695 domain-containing protein [Myroides albus]MVX36671.1 DUF2695 domain-containing protein [Myroides sp. LoEW2-1]